MMDIEQYKEWPTEKLDEFIKALYSIVEERNLEELKIEKLTVENGAMEIKLTPGQEYMAAMAHCFGNVLEENNAKNFVVMEIVHPKYGPMTLTIQRSHGEKSVLSELARLKAYDEAAAK